ncbi:universal stress protein [Paraburkholderia diazotrophica]|uniref:Nucleotide-binding universal stress protein, UspA family n=1 Tax=Paraburkholderia diazotrophica TaxID=667676 RepID=A0A1H7E3K9_9BURK|nr:universal stress protein [Paraburkholderia diazotrophica]SEK08549.1 Nucleotide-binding universal stress protein, UspA family [Paraburkholderia diazotrophica]
MASFKRVLLCYDATREGRRALCEGAELARQSGAETHLLAVLDRLDLAYGADVIPAVPLGSTEQAAKEILDESVGRLAELGVKVTGHFVVGNPIDEIARCCDELKPDLVVLGHHRRGMFARWWDGRDDTRLLDRLSCAVLVVHAQKDIEADAVS